MNFIKNLFRKVSDKCNKVAISAKTAITNASG